MIPSSSAFEFKEGEIALNLTDDGRRAILSAKVMCGDDESEMRKALGWSSKDWKDAIRFCQEFKEIVERDPIDSLRGETLAAVMDLLREREPGMVKMCAQALIPEMGFGATTKSPSILDEIVKSISKSKLNKESGGHVDDNPNH